ncbi:DUF6416 domain-containing protein [Streptomyces sp. NPDC050433]|uniref:DUF6416 domain-containing protein n=1 Tax=Streptomyces sp. NPDC050433 TaxID=3365615 RepID=UPI0037A4612D
MSIIKPNGHRLRLAGIAEAADIYDADKSLVRRVLASPRAPQPIDVLASGPVYDRDDLEEHAATRNRKIGRPMARTFPASMRIADTDPLWDDHDGGSGHDGLPQWQPGDIGKALAYWETLDRKGQSVLAYLFDHPGRLVNHSELVEELRLDPEGKKNAAKVMAGALTKMGTASPETDRSYPYRWWKTPNGTVYAVKHEVAEIFKAALKQ